MGQKVHPTGIRLGITKRHTSTWYAGKEQYADKLLEDINVRNYIRKALASAATRSVARLRCVLHPRPARLLHAVRGLRRCMWRMPARRTDSVHRVGV